MDSDPCSKDCQEKSPSPEAVVKSVDKPGDIPDEIPTKKTKFEESEKVLLDNF